MNNNVWSLKSISNTAVAYMDFFGGKLHASKYGSKQNISLDKNMLRIYDMIK